MMKNLCTLETLYANINPQHYLRYVPKDLIRLRKLHNFYLFISFMFGGLGQAWGEGERVWK